MRELREYYERMYQYTAGVDLSRYEKTHRVKVFLSRAIARAFSIFLRGERPGAVLDIGCGRGDNLVTLARHFSPTRLVGGDISFTILAFAARRFREMNFTGVSLVNYDAEALPFKENSFHTVLATELLEHLPHDRAGIREAARVLDGDGLLILGTPSVPADRETADYSLPEVLSRGESIRDKGGHFRQYTMSRLEDRLREGGFQVERWFSSGKKFYRLAQRLNNFCIARARRRLRVPSSGEDPYLTTYLSSGRGKGRSRILITIYTYLFLPAWNAISALDYIFQRSRPGTRIFIKARKS
jgi:ubiquinone/menaquinone biosynthesis C-methylase UbiE